MPRRASDVGSASNVVSGQAASSGRRRRGHAGEGLVGGSDRQGRSGQEQGCQCEGRGAADSGAERMARILRAGTGACTRHAGRRHACLPAADRGQQASEDLVGQQPAATA